MGESRSSSILQAILYGDTSPGVTFEKNYQRGKTLSAVCEELRPGTKKVGYVEKNPEKEAYQAECPSCGKYEGSADQVVGLCDAADA